MGETTDLSQLENVLKLNFDAENVAQLSACVGELVAAIQQGGEISEEDVANLQVISEMLNGLDTYGIGAHVTEGVAQGMTEGAGRATQKPSPPTLKPRSTARWTSSRPPRA